MAGELDRGNSQKWKRTRKQVFNRDGRECVFCGHHGDTGNPLTVDHIVPRYRGGTDALSNLRVLCRRCNSGRKRGSSRMVKRSRMKVVAYETPFTR